MKTTHKTIRQNVWETNSSSSHAVSLCIREKNIPTMKPYASNAEIIVSLRHDYTYEDWENKMGLLGAYLVLSEQEDKLSKVEDIISDFAGINIRFNVSEIPVLTKYGKGKERIEGEFYLFTKAQYDEVPIDDFITDVEKILASDELILSFVCSTGWLNVSEYYDG